LLGLLKNMNPFVTPGAIATTGHVKGANVEEVWAKRSVAMATAMARRNTGRIGVRF
jgi:glutaminase